MASRRGDDDAAGGDHGQVAEIRRETGHVFLDPVDQQVVGLALVRLDRLATERVDQHLRDRHRFHRVGREVEHEQLALALHLQQSALRRELDDVVLRPVVRKYDVRRGERGVTAQAVSYTHLTLPTIYSV